MPELSSLPKDVEGFDRIRDHVFAADDKRHEREGVKTSGEHIARGFSFLQKMLSCRGGRGELGHQKSTSSQPEHSPISEQQKTKVEIKASEDLSQAKPSVPEGPTTSTRKYERQAITVPDVWINKPEEDAFNNWLEAQRKLGYSEEEIPNRIQNNEFSELFGTIEGVRDRAMTITRIDVSPSRATYGGEKVTGTHGFLVRHVPLFPEEVRLLGLRQEDVRQYRVSYLILDGVADEDTDRYAQLLDRRGGDLAKAEFSAIAGSVLDRYGDQDAPTPQLELLQKYLDVHPDREMFMILSHGSTMDKDEGDAESKNKYVVQLEGTESVETIDYVLKSEVAAHPDAYSVVLDRSCNEFGVIPDVVDLPIPYFGSLNVVGPTVGKDSVVITDGKVMHFFADQEKLHPKVTL